MLVRIKDKNVNVVIERNIDLSKRIVLLVGRNELFSTQYYSSSNNKDMSKELSSFLSNNR